MANYQYHRPGASTSGCAGTGMAGGWYEQGGDTPIVSDYLNPATGAAYTPTELSQLVNGETLTEEDTQSENTGAAPYPEPPQISIPRAPVLGNISDTSVPEMPPLPEMPPAPEMPENEPYDPNAVPLPEVEEAPSYEASAEEQAWAKMHGGNVQDIIEQGGLGLSEEIQQLMTDKNNEALIARESEAIRVMKNNMARRGIDNWGLEFKNIQQIKAATTKGIAANVRDIRIQNALMKMQSFENALGMSAHFLDYLGQQSQLAYASNIATWQAKQQAKLTQYQANVDVWKTKQQARLVEHQANLDVWKTKALTDVNVWQTKYQANVGVWDTKYRAKQQAKLLEYQAKVDVWKMKVNQAYTVGNMEYAQQLAEHGAEIQHQNNIEIEEMKIDAAEKAASAQGFWQAVGTILGFAAMFFFL